MQLDNEFIIRAHSKSTPVMPSNSSPSVQPKHLRLTELCVSTILVMRWSLASFNLRWGVTKKHKQIINNVKTYKQLLKQIPENSLCLEAIDSVALNFELSLARIWYCTLWLLIGVFTLWIGISQFRRTKNMMSLGFF